MGGGQNNEVAESFATVSGGELNEALATASAVGGGRNNTVAADFATVAGGLKNTASGR